jgi:hypothetical protein
MKTSITVLISSLALILVSGCAVTTEEETAEDLAGDEVASEEALEDVGTSEQALTHCYTYRTHNVRASCGIERGCYRRGYSTYSCRQNGLYATRRCCQRL